MLGLFYSKKLFENGHTIPFEPPPGTTMPKIKDLNLGQINPGAILGLDHEGKEVKYNFVVSLRENGTPYGRSLLESFPDAELKSLAYVERPVRDRDGTALNTDKWAEWGYPHNYAKPSSGEHDDDHMSIPMLGMD
jgi:hypothetical protein